MAQLIQIGEASLQFCRNQLSALGVSDENIKRASDKVAGALIEVLYGTNGQMPTASWQPVMQPMAQYYGTPYLMPTYNMQPPMQPMQPAQAPMPAPMQTMQPTQAHAPAPAPAQIAQAPPARNNRPRLQPQVQPQVHLQPQAPPVDTAPAPAPAPIAAAVPRAASYANVANKSVPVPNRSSVGVVAGTDVVFATDVRMPGIIKPENTVLSIEDITARAQTELEPSSNWGDDANQ